jgi:hypothetical protein
LGVEEKRRRNGFRVGVTIIDGMLFRSEAMVTVKSSQKIFTDSEVASLTGICLDHIHKFARSRHLGFIARAAEAAGNADNWLFTLSDLMVIVTLFPKCTH